jgi:hypothetical protein
VIGQVVRLRLLLITKSVDLELESTRNWEGVVCKSKQLFQFEHTASTEVGDSGAPTFDKDVVVGLHGGATMGGTKNRAISTVALTPKRLFESETSTTPTVDSEDLWLMRADADADAQDEYNFMREERHAEREREENERMDNRRRQLEDETISNFSRSDRMAQMQFGNLRVLATKEGDRSYHVTAQEIREDLNATVSSAGNRLWSQIEEDPDFDPFDHEFESDPMIGEKEEVVDVSAPVKALDFPAAKEGGQTLAGMNLPEDSRKFVEHSALEVTLGQLTAQIAALSVQVARNTTELSKLESVEEPTQLTPNKRSRSAKRRASRKLKKQLKVSTDTPSPREEEQLNTDR